MSCKLSLLHRLPAWNKKINEFICLKMSLLNEIISEIAGLQMTLQVSCHKLSQAVSKLSQAVMQAVVAGRGR